MDVTTNPHRSFLLPVLIGICIGTSTQAVANDTDGFTLPATYTLADTQTPHYVPVPNTSPACGCDSPWQLHVRPNGFVYPTYWASDSEPRLATHIIETQDGGAYLDSHIGGRLGLLRFGPRDREEGLQFDLLGGAKLRQNRMEGLDVWATDYRYDILSTYGKGRNRFKFGFYHVSSHVGDEYMLKHPAHDRLNFSRDALVAGYSFYPTRETRLYAELGWAFSCDISEPWELQLGVDIGPTTATGPRGAPFIGMNVHLREELDFGGNFALQTGWAWRGESHTSGLLRTGFYFYDGGSSQYSFYACHEQQLGAGLWYDF